MSDGPRLTILFDNEPGLPGLTSLWGFASLIEIAGRRILFDTGSNGRVLLTNMRTLGVASDGLDLVFLSHPHWDHIGGLDSILEENPRCTVVVHDGFSKHLIQDLRGLCGTLAVVGSDPLELAPGVLSTGMLASDPPEQAMLIDTAGVTAVIGGCAHPGMESIVARSIDLCGKSIDWAVGGFHLMYSDARQIADAIRALRDLDVGYVLPTHCTGAAAKQAFRDAFGARCVDGGAGRQIPLLPRRESAAGH